MDVDSSDAEDFVGDQIVRAAVEGDVLARPYPGVAVRTRAIAIPRAIPALVPAPGPGLARLGPATPLWARRPGKNVGAHVT